MDARLEAREGVACTRDAASRGKFGFTEACGWPRFGVHKLKPKPRPDFAKAFAAAGGAGAVQIAFLLPADLRRAIAEIMPLVPKEFGGGSSKPLTHGLAWGALSVDLPPRLSMRLVVQAIDGPSAESLRALLPFVAQVFDLPSRSGGVIPDPGRLVKQTAATLDMDRVTLTLDGKALAEHLSPEIAQLRGSAAWTVSANNLRQLGLGLHNYHDANSRFPAPANYDDKGKPLLSWRVHLLPYVEEGELYKQFRLDEPWGSAHNKKLIAKMPAVFRRPHTRVGDEGKTTYLAPVGENTAFSRNKQTRLASFRDGTSNTILLVEASDDHAVSWTKPDDLNYDAKQPAKGLRKLPGDVFLVAMADGSVRPFSTTISAASLQALFTRNGGEVIGADVFREHRVFAWLPSLLRND